MWSLCRQLKLIKMWPPTMVCCHLPCADGAVLGRGEAWLSQSIPGHTTLAFTPNRAGPLIHFLPELPAVRCSGWVENLELVCPCSLKCCIWTASSQENTTKFPCLILSGLAPHVASLFWAKQRTISLLISEHFVQSTRTYSPHLQCCLVLCEIGKCRQLSWLWRLKD